MIRYINKVLNNENLTVDESKDVMDKMLDGGATPIQISSFLTALRMKGETIDEITGCAMKMKEKACHINPQIKDYIDCVGTGGDGTNTFNISTTSAFVIAGAGVPVAKHGNRAVSSRSGSADLLEELGVNIMIEPELVERCVDEIGIGFMFARTFNKHMKSVSGVRSELKTRTIFNILGPISNPSNAKYQVIGVFSKDLTNPLANAMLNMGVERGMVVSGIDNGMDEISTIGKTYVSEIKDGKVIDYIITPEEFGLKKATSKDIEGGNIQENAKTTIAILKGEKGYKRDIVVFNAGVALYVADKVKTIEDGIKLAQETIDNNRAYEKLQELIELTNR